MKVSIFSNRLDRGAFHASFRGVAWALYEYEVGSIELIYYNGEQPDNFPPGTKYTKLRGSSVKSVLYELMVYLKKEAPDFLIVGPTYINIAVVAITLFSTWKKKGGKLILTHHHPLRLAYQHTKKNNKYLAWLLYRYAAGSFGASPSAVQEAIEVANLPPTSVGLIPNMVVPDQKLQVHDEILLPPSTKFTFLTLSRLAPEKNIPFLIDCFAEVANKRSARLIIVGVGPERKKIEECIKRLGLKNIVDLLGFVPSSQGIISQCDAFLLSSNEEGFGQVLVEAMFVGKPVVCTAAKGGGVSFVTDKGKYAKLTQLGDKQAFVNAMLEIMDPTENEKYKVLSLQRANDFSPKKVGKDLVEFLKFIDEYET